LRLGGGAHVSHSIPKRRRNEVGTEREKKNRKPPKAQYMKKRSNTHGEYKWGAEEKKKKMVWRKVGQKFVGKRKKNMKNGENINDKRKADPTISGPMPGAKGGSGRTRPMQVPE